jgi:hypothetical protein
MIDLFKVGNTTSFSVRAANGTLTGKRVSYLTYINTEKQQYFSYGFDPDTMSEEVARQNFQILLDEHLARPFNPDGGLLNGEDIQ